TEMRTTPTFLVDYAQPGQFRIRVNTVSNFGHLRLLLDGHPVWERRLSAAPPTDPNAKPEYAETTYRKEYGVYQARFDREYAIDVPAGAHRLTLENTEGDWISLANITLTGYRSSRYPSVNLYGLTDGRRAILWAQNALHNWKNAADKRSIPTLRDAVT